jgi:serine/threonine-protein kinase
MDGDPRVRQLLEELLDSERTPEEVCRECPELLSAVHRRWQRKRDCDAELDAMFLTSGPRSPFGSPASTPSSAELPRISGYEVLEVVGRGGMGVVYRARHVGLDRPVALKMLLTGTHTSREARERFLREARMGAGLRHPNFVQVHDMGHQDGLPYFTMEFVEGGNLAQKLAGMPQPPRQAAALLATLAEAVQEAHRCGIVHRDLKPANVLITADGTPKICDLGLARRLEGEAGLTWTGSAVGTPSYMAPEQAETRPQTLGAAVDIHALGAILYELLTGRPPFRAATAAETVRQVISHDPVPPSQLNGEVPHNLETICLKCLQKEPHLRYTDAAALAEDLHRFLGGEAISARPDGRLARLTRQVRRQPMQSALVAAVLLMSAALLGGGLRLISQRAAGARKLQAGPAASERAAETDQSRRSCRCGRRPDPRGGMEGNGRGRDWTSAGRMVFEAPWTEVSSTRSWRTGWTPSAWRDAPWPGESPTLRGTRARLRRRIRRRRQAARGPRGEEQGLGSPDCVAGRFRRRVFLRPRYAPTAPGIGRGDPGRRGLRRPVLRGPRLANRKDEAARFKVIKTASFPG